MNQSVLYLECNSGISGDMTVAALLDLGADRQVLTDALASLPLTGYSIEIKDVYKSGLRARDFNVVLEHDNHDHDMEYLHGHAHDSDVSTKPHHHAHESRNLQDITEIINAGKLSNSARKLALRIFRILAKAEASVHGKSIDEIHFHEVGAVDSIVDIVAAAVCLDNLHPARVIVSPLTDGTGQIRCQHGIIPVPVPAVTAIAAQNDLILKLTDIEGELVTPTGAAIAAALTSSDIWSSDVPQTAAVRIDPHHSAQSHTVASLPSEFRIRGIGLGAGKRGYATTGVLRAMLLEPQDMMSPVGSSSSHGTGRNGHTAHSFRDNCGDDNCDDDNCGNTNYHNDDSSDTILSLESNIDDCTGEALSFTMQALLDHGALDVFYAPIYMKKNRPAYLLRVLCHADRRAELESIIFKNTTTIGIRVQEMQRTKLPRQVVSVETPWGVADVKCCTHNGETFCYPENDSVSELARNNQIGFPEMYHQIQEYARKTLGS